MLSELPEHVASGVRGVVFAAADADPAVAEAVERVLIMGEPLRPTVRDVGCGLQRVRGAIERSRRILRSYLPRMGYSCPVEQDQATPAAMSS